MPQSAPTRADAIQKLRELTKSIHIAMLCTATPEGTLRSRPMATQEITDDGELWFFTDAGSPKVDEVLENQQVNVAYAEPANQTYVSVSGEARLVRDPAKIRELWKPAYKAWFPDGLDDPNIALLHVRVTQAEYWDTPSSTMVHLIGVAKALATGQRYEPGDHEKLDMDDAGVLTTTA
jgi:general stress protein 26